MDAVRRAFKYRIYPSKAQASLFSSWLEICWELYNGVIEERREAWRCGISVTFKTQSAQLPEIKKIRPEIETLYSQVLQNVLHRVDFAFQAFFRRVKNGEIPGYPRFKSRDRYDSFTFPQNIAFSVRGKLLRLSKLGHVKIKLHRPIEGTPKTCSIKREAGKWYAVFSCDDVPARDFPFTENEVGIDVGIESFAALSTGEKVENPRWYRKTEEGLADAQRELSRRKRGSNRRAKARRGLARLHAKAKNQRQDFHHKLAHRIVSDNALIAVEDLSVREMIEKSPSGMKKSISDAGWSGFMAILGAKAEEAGRRFVKVPPRGTSSTCSECGAFRQKTLSERTHRCENCGLMLDRDVNASLNILRLGRSLRGSSSREAAGL